LECAAKALEANGIKVIIAGVRVFTGLSMTLEALGIPAEVDKRYNSVLAKMDRATQGRGMIKMCATPEWMLVIASNTGSQLAGYAASAAHVVRVVGAQKIDPNLDEAFKRAREYTYPREDERMLQAYGMNSNISKLLIVHREVMPGRTTMILVKENLGF
jgi:hypothetical protein